MIRNFNYVFSFLILFFVFQVNANQCNEELVKDLPPNLPTSHYTSEELKQFINEGLDEHLFLLMDENINLTLEYSYINNKNYDCESRTYNKYQIDKETEVFEKQNVLNNISLPCNQKKKILDQVWKDFDNMNTPGYLVRVCDKDLELLCGYPYMSHIPKRQLKYLNSRYYVALSEDQCKKNGKVRH